jgi:hypothetical protein
VLGAINVTSVVVLIAVGSAFALTQAVKRGSRRFRSSLEVRDGRVVMSDATRLKLERHGRDLSKAEAFIAQNFSVDERGEIVERRNLARPTAGAPEPTLGSPSEPVVSETRQAPIAETGRGEIAVKTLPGDSRGQSSLESARPFYRKPSMKDLLSGPGSSQGD